MKHHATAKTKKVGKETKRLLDETFNDPNDLFSEVVDMLANLRHTCLLHGLKFDEAVKVSDGHFKAEAGLEGEG